MIPLLLPTALAAPPAGIDPDDFSHWEAAADAALDGPAGCWELSGAVRLDGGLHNAGTALIRGDTFKISNIGTWEGRIEEGRWTAFTYQWTEEQGGTLDVPILPLVGTIDPDIVVRRPSKQEDHGKDHFTFEWNEEGESSSAEAINLFHDLVDSWEPAGSTTVSEWSEELGAIRLIQDIPLLDKVNPPVVTVTSLFPGGDPHPTVIDASFPKRIKLGEWPLRVTLMDTRFHLRQQRVGSYVLPQVEGFTLLAGALGFTLGYEQQLTYATAQACTSRGAPSSQGVDAPHR